MVWQYDGTYTAHYTSAAERFINRRVRNTAPLTGYYIMMKNKQHAKNLAAHPFETLLSQRSR